MKNAIYSKRIAHLPVHAVDLTNKLLVKNLMLVYRCEYSIDCSLDRSKQVSQLFVTTSSFTARYNINTRTTLLCLSVCLSHSGIVQQWLNTSTKFFQCIYSPNVQVFPELNHVARFRQQSPQLNRCVKYELGIQEFTFFDEYINRNSLRYKIPARLPMRQVGKFLAVNGRFYHTGIVTLREFRDEISKFRKAEMIELVYI